MLGEGGTPLLLQKEKHGSVKFEVNGTVHVYRNLNK